MTGDATFQNDLLVRGEITCTSDMTLKKNINNIDNALDKINKINGVEFNWIVNNRKSFGIVAQEVEEILPEAVVNNSNGFKSVNYNCLVGLMVEALKEQNEKYNSLEKQFKDYMENNK